MNYLPATVYVLLALVWGSNFIFVKWAAESITPAQITLLRVFFGFVPVLIFALARRALSWSHLRHLHHFVVMALLATAVYYYAFAAGTALLPSGVAGMLGGAIPLFTFLCAWIFLKEETIGARQVVGILLGLGGIILIAAPWSSNGQIAPLGVAWMIGGSLSVGSSFVYARRFVTPLRLPAAALTTYQIGLGLLFLLLFTDRSGMGALLGDRRASVGLVLGLGLCGTGLAYIAYYYLIDRLGAVTASSVTYLPPIVALFIGVVLAGEDITPATGAAVVLILAGVACLQRFKLPGAAVVVLAAARRRTPR